MRMRPGAHFFEARFEGLAHAAIVDVLHVHHLEARLQHHALRVERRIGRKLRLGHHPRPGGMREAAAFAVGEDVELDLPHAAVELARERFVLVVEALEGLRDLSSAKALASLGAMPA